jgi:hypothetical protein
MELESGTQREVPSDAAVQLLAFTLLRIRISNYLKGYDAIPDSS